MKKRLAALGAVALALSQAIAATASEQKAPGKVGASEALMVRATVEAVDVAARTVTLKGPKGKTFTVSVDPKHPSLEKLKAGDEVVATYYEAVAFELKKPGEAVPGRTEKDVVGPGKAGEAGRAGRQLKVVATITAIDEVKGSVTLTGADGKTVEVKARDPRNLKLVKAGDLVEITYTEALAVSIEPASKAPAK